MYLASLKLFRIRLLYKYIKSKMFKKLILWAIFFLGVNQPLEYIIIIILKMVNLFDLFLVFINLVF